MRVPPPQAPASTRPLQAPDAAGARTSDAPQTVESVIRSWSTAWRAALKTRTTDDQRALDDKTKDVIADIQETVKADTGQVFRAQHAKAVYATTNARFTVRDDLPPELAHGPFAKPGALRALVRISNVSGHAQPDGEPDLRGIAVRLTDDDGHVQDLLLNTSEQFMAADAHETLAGARAREKGARGLFGLIGSLGVFDTLSLLGKTRAVKSSGRSIAAHTFWTRTPFQLGAHAIKLRLVPAPDESAALRAGGDDALKDDLQARLRERPVKFLLQVQGYRDEARTPLEDARVIWRDSPFVTVGELELPAQTGTREREDSAALEKVVDQLAFSPLHTWAPDQMEPLGEINAIRKVAYQASADGRGVKGASGLKCPFGFGG